MEQIPQYAESLGVIGVMMAVAFSIYKGWLVTGHEHKSVIELHKEAMAREIARGDKADAQLEAAVVAQRVANETIARTASMVPDLVASLAKLSGEAANERR